MHSLAEDGLDGGVETKRRSVIVMEPVAIRSGDGGDDGGGGGGGDDDVDDVVNDGGGGMRTCFIAEAKPPVAPHGGSAMPITQGLCGAMTVGQTTPRKESVPTCSHPDPAAGKSKFAVGSSARGRSRDSGRAADDYDDDPIP
ncbi:hypothetical protein An01g10530 [Aspergillus niger]|uniref:Uncharacterized protein n=2 Tax=Aspergillus niger TaxID=5061 RepID=A2QA82_ASPNC|nr:hypothetical protein An01g10530 [Aspergillus niger]CAK37234.1 hypothetical protein An01g10530 [Aspergillus niger]